MLLLLVNPDLHVDLGPVTFSCQSNGDDRFIDSLIFEDGFKAGFQSVLRTLENVFPFSVFFHVIRHKM